MQTKTHARLPVRLLEFLEECANYALEAGELSSRGIIIRYNRIAALHKIVGHDEEAKRVRALLELIKELLRKGEAEAARESQQSGKD